MFGPVLKISKDKSILIEQILNFIKNFKICKKLWKERILISGTYDWLNKNVKAALTAERSFQSKQWQLQGVALIVR